MSEVLSILVALGSLSSRWRETICRKSYVHLAFAFLSSSRRCSERT